MAISEVRPSRAWSPWLAGAGIGLIAWVGFLNVNRPLGITRAFEDLAALISRFFVPSLAESSSYFRAHWIVPDWEWAFIVGIPLGALLSVYLTQDRAPGIVPDLWRRRFGDGRGLRLASAFVGATVMMLGARIAGGCTTGHAMAGTMQLAVSSVIFIAVFAPVAVLTARALYGKEA